MSPVTNDNATLPDFGQVAELLHVQGLIETIIYWPHHVCLTIAYTSPRSIAATEDPCLVSCNATTTGYGANSPQTVGFYEGTHVPGKLPVVNNSPRQTS